LVGPDAGAEQRLVRVDVAHPDDQLVVHQRELDRDAPAARAAVQQVRVEGRRERLGAERRDQRVRRGVALDPQHRPEAARVAVPEA
jgi:hypothetical protein